MSNPLRELAKLLMLRRPTPHLGDARTKAVPDHELSKDQGSVHSSGWTKLINIKRIFLRR